MARLRIKIELQRPAAGIEMSKLERLSKGAQQMLRSLGDDLRVAMDGTWVAQKFYDQGVGFDAVYETGDVDELQVDQYIHALSDVTTVDAENRWSVRGVSPKTLVLSARLAKLADEGETIRIGLYREQDPAVDWRPLIRSRAEALIEFYEQVVVYRGMLQGLIHSWYKESDPPYFDLRDIASRELVKCYYKVEQYEDVYKSLKDRRAVLLVSGWIETRRSDREISRFDVDRIMSVKPINASELEKFFGSSPGWTGDLTTEDFIEAVRRRGDGE